MGDEDVRSYCCQFREILMRIHDDIPFHHLLECFIRGLQHWPDVYKQMCSYFQQGAFDNWMQVFHMVKDIACKLTSEPEHVGVLACDEPDDDVMLDWQSVASEESEVCAYCDLLGHTVTECQVLDFYNLKAAEHEACSYCNLTGHTIGECQVLEYCKLHNLCTYCKMQGHSIQECQQASDFHRDFHEHQRQYEVQKPNFSYAQVHVSDIFYLSESSTSVSDEECMSKEEGSEKMQGFVDMPETHRSCFEDPCHSKYQTGLHCMPTPQVQADLQVNNPAPKESGGDDEVCFDIADLFEEEEPAREEQDMSQVSGCYHCAIAYDGAISLAVTAHKPSIVPKALLPTASTDKTISFDHTLPSPKLSVAATTSFEPIATQEDSTNAIVNAGQFPIKSTFYISTLETLSTVVKKSPYHFAAVNWSIPDLLCLPTWSSSSTCFQAQESAPLLLLYARSKTGIG